MAKRERWRRWQRERERRRRAVASLFAKGKMVSSRYQRGEEAENSQSKSRWGAAARLCRVEQLEKVDLGFFNGKGWRLQREKGFRFLGFFYYFRVFFLWFRVFCGSL
jgi:hypothetical protein